MSEARSLDEPLVLHATSNGIAMLTLNSAHNFNALSSAMIAALHDALVAIGEHTDVRVVVIEARGKAFCAGHDLREMRAHDDEGWQRELFARCSDMMMSIANLPQPVIAKVQGIATAAGCQLVAMCDLAIAAETAKFATSGIALGLFCSTPAVPLARSVSAKHAAAMLFTGEFITAQRAESIGLINRVVSEADLDAEADAIAARIARHSARSLRSGKKLLQSLQQANAMADAYRLAGENMACDMATNDAKNGIDAFLEKRASPAWLNR